VMIVTVIVPALDAQSFKKSVHLVPRREVIRPGYGDSMNPL
jgi:hypothetical protein